MQYAKYFSLLSGKTNAYWVSVHSLKSHEGGILDPDDLICDVCDDREQLAAIYDEQNGGHYHGGGDGMSSASDSDLKESITGSLSSNENLLQVWIFFRSTIFLMVSCGASAAVAPLCLKSNNTGSAINELRLLPYFFDLLIYILLWISMSEKYSWGRGSWETAVMYET